MELGQKIVKLRKKKDWSQEVLAEKLGISQSSLSRTESGEIENFKRQFISNLANTFGVNPLALVKDTDYFLKFKADQLMICPNDICHVPGTYEPFNPNTGEGGKWGADSRFVTNGVDESGYEAKFCPHCGADLIFECPNCQQELTIPRAKHCTGCGEELRGNVEKNS